MDMKPHALVNPSPKPNLVIESDECGALPTEVSLFIRPRKPDKPTNTNIFPRGI